MRKPRCQLAEDASGSGNPPCGNSQAALCHCSHHVLTCAYPHDTSSRSIRKKEHRPQSTKIYLDVLERMPNDDQVRRRIFAWLSMTFKHRNVKTLSTFTDTGPHSIRMRDTFIPAGENGFSLKLVPCESFYQDGPSRGFG